MTTFILKHLDIHRKVVLGSIGFLSLEPLDLSRNLVDLGLGELGVRGDLHREYKVHDETVSVKRLSQLFLISLRLTATDSSW